MCGTSATASTGTWCTRACTSAYASSCAFSSAETVIVNFTDDDAGSGPRLNRFTLLLTESPRD